MATTIKHASSALAPVESFVPRHIGPSPSDIDKMVSAIGFRSLDDLIDATIPEKIRLRKNLALPTGRAEFEVLAEFRALAARNRVYRSFIGMGYADTVTPP